MTLYNAITVFQPWATMIAEECKPIEFRGHRVPEKLIGRRIAIHAAARKVHVIEVKAILAQLYSDNWRETGLIRDPAIALLERVQRDPTSLPLSSIVCTAELEPPLEREKLAERLGFALVNDSDRHEHTKWGWPLRAVQRVMPPLPARGSQGWWRIAISTPASAEERAQASIAAAALVLCADVNGAAGVPNTTFLTVGKPRRGVRHTTWSNLPGLSRSNDKYSHELLPDWEYTRAEMLTEMVADLRHLAATGERPTTETGIET